MPELWGAVPQRGERQVLGFLALSQFLFGVGVLGLGCLRAWFSDDMFDSGGP